MVNVALVHSATRYFSIIIGSIILLVGLVGNGLIICVFSNRKGKFRKTPCSLYFVSMSLIKTLHLIHVMVYFMMSIGFDVDPTLTSLAYCKLRYYLGQATMPPIINTLECAAMISQFLATSQKIYYRQKNTHKMARICIFLILLFWCVQAVPVIIMYNIKIMPETNKTVCDSFSTAFRHYSIWFVRILVVFIFPCIILPLFAYLTLRNVRRLTSNSNRQQRIDRQMFLVSLFHFFSHQYKM
jgi:hypothetical protein